jgi:hypothetical protein
MIDIQALADEWLAAKAAESAAIAKRRKIEDDLVKALEVPDTLDGTVNHKHGLYVVKVEGRINRKVDAEKVQELAAEAGLTDHLSSLFRWKPEINMTVWKQTSPEITTPLLGAITSSNGRPSFSIAIKE